MRCLLLESHDRIKLKERKLSILGVDAHNAAKLKFTSEVQLARDASLHDFNDWLSLCEVRIKDIKSKASEHQQIFLPE